MHGSPEEARGDLAEGSQDRKRGHPGRFFPTGWRLPRTDGDDGGNRDRVWHGRSRDVPVESEHRNAGTDRGAFAGRAGRKIAVRRAATEWLAHSVSLHSRVGRESLLFSRSGQGTWAGSTVLRRSRSAAASRARGVHAGATRRAILRRDSCDASPRSVSSRGALLSGGILAFEVARQLVAAGLEVALLVLFEVPTPGYPRIARHWRKYLRQSAGLASRRLRGKSGNGWDEVRAHFDVWKTLFVRKRQAIIRRVLVSTRMQEAIPPREPLHTRNECAGRAYIPRKLKCNVVHFLAADELHRTLILDDPRLGWGEVVGDGFSIRKVPGIADGIFKPPNVRELASQLRSLLDTHGLALASPKERCQ